MSKRYLFGKRHIVNVLTAAALAGVLAAQAVFQTAALWIYVDKFGYSVNGSVKEAVIEDCNAEGNDVIIPEYVYSYRIVGVNRSAFDDPNAVTLYFYSESDAYYSALEQQLDCRVMRLGDADFSEITDIYDVTEIQRYLAEYIDFGAPQLLVADVNRDGYVSIDDATFLQEYLAQIHPLSAE